jgi:hypothetical protein
MTITHFGPRYPKPALQPDSAAQTKPDETTRTAPAYRSWDAYTLKSKEENGHTVGFWEKIPNRFDRVDLSRKRPASKTDSIKPASVKGHESVESLLPAVPPSTPTTEKIALMTPKDELKLPSIQQSPKFKLRHRISQWVQQRLNKHLEKKS